MKKKLLINKIFFDESTEQIKKYFGSLDEATEYVKTHYENNVEMYTIGYYDSDGIFIGCRYIYKDEETGEIIY